MKIHAIETGRVRIKTNQLQKAEGKMPKLMKVLLDRNWSEWLPIYCWAIEHHEGVIVVDTGDTHRTSEKGYLPKWHPYYALGVEFDIRAEDEIGPQLRRLGIDPRSDVTKVVLTHLHTDHAGGIYHFPESEIIIDRKEYKAASGLAGMFAGYLPHRWPEWLRPTLMDLPANPYGPFNKSLALTSDRTIMAVATPGHVANHISVIATNEGINYMFAGDTSYTEENMLKGITDGIGTEDTAITLHTIREFTKLHPTIYLPSHDPKALERLSEKRISPNYRDLIPAS